MDRSSSSKSSRRLARVDPRHSGSNFTFKYKFAILGAAGVGKTALVRRWMTGEDIDDSYEPTIDASYEHHIQFMGCKVPLQIVDTGGSHSFPPMRKFLAKCSHAFLIVVDVNEPKSLAKAKQIYDELSEWRCDGGGGGASARAQVPAVIAANKEDVVGSRDRVVADAEAFADSIGCPFVLTSAKADAGVESAFRRLIEVAQKFYSLDLFTTLKPKKLRRTFSFSSFRKVKWIKRFFSCKRQ
ncbi:GTP-binding protein Di-Ras2-like [Oscarella lobularis]|uniref:GTP-binding protein Di-Ras2-like n=1 Tax=Oscarella lobularis TaxID=121494 RepID=UPI0033142A27